MKRKVGGPAGVGIYTIPLWRLFELDLGGIVWPWRHEHMRKEL